MRKSRRRYSKQPGYIRKPRRTYSKKTGYSGLIRAAIWTVILIVMALLSRNNALIDKILFWPMVFD